MKKLIYICFKTNFEEPTVKVYSKIMLCRLFISVCLLSPHRRWKGTKPIAEESLSTGWVTS